MRALPKVATTVSSDPAAYVYLAESIRAWPVQAELAGDLAVAGWSQVAWRDLTGGIVALHRGVKPLSGAGAGAPGTVVDSLVKAFTSRRGRRA